MLSTGTLVGSYRITRHIASGGMGAVYEARHESMGFRVAIKIPLTDGVHDPVSAARLQNEAIAASVVEHPHAIKIFEYGELRSGLPYLIMEFLPGKTLAAYLKLLRESGGRSPDFTTIVDIGAQIAGALAVAHRRETIHRDVKPNNIVLVPLHGRTGRGSQAERWHGVLIDFNIAKLPPNVAPDVPALTAPGQWLGTKEYMAPEQAEDAAMVTDRVDVYALGVVLYEMLTGKLPQSVSRRGMHAKATPTIELPDDASRHELALGSLVAQMLVERPEARPTADHVEDALRLLFIEASAPPAPDADMGPPTSRTGPATMGNTGPRASLGVKPPWRGISPGVKWLAISNLILLGIVGLLAAKEWRQPIPVPPPPSRMEPLQSPLIGARSWRRVAVQGNPQDNLSGVWGSSPSDIWAIGRQRGTLLHYDGRTWTQATGPALNGNLSLYAIWGSGPQDIWAVGSKGALLHFNGEWERVSSVTDADLLAIGGSSGSDILAAGREVLLHFNGRGWEPLEVHERYNFHGVFFAGPGNAWIVGYNDINSGVTLRYNGKEVKIVAKNELRMRDVWGDPSGVVWAVATRAPSAGYVLRWEKDKGWREAFRASRWLTTLWGTSSTDVWATGEGGLFIHFDGSTWQRALTSEPDGTFRGLWGTRDELWAVGERTTILHLREWPYTPIGLPLPNNLNDIWGESGKGAWAVGSRGTLLQYSGNDWNRWELPIQHGLNGIHGCNSNDVWIVGDEGSSLHFDGKAWTPIPTETTERLLGVACQDGTAWAVGARGTLMRFVGGAWQRLDSNVHEDLRSIWGSAANNLWAVGQSGMVLQIAGGRLNRVDAGVSSDCSRVWGGGPEDVWIATHDGFLIHFDHGTFAPPQRLVAGAIRALSGTSNSDIWAAGSGGMLMHFDGKAWSKLRSGTQESILGIFSEGPGNIFLVGERGGIWH